MPAGNAVWDELRYFHPGYCVQSVDRIKIETGSDVYPCCVGSGGNLRLGNIERQTFQEVWNGPEAQDLRRAMLTLDPRFQAVQQQAPEDPVIASMIQRGLIDAEILRAKHRSARQARAPTMEREIDQASPPTHTTCARGIFELRQLGGRALELGGGQGHGLDVACSH